MGKASRKGKKAWRKNIDTADVRGCAFVFLVEDGYKFS
jgi:hypothetical protein